MQFTCEQRLELATIAAEMALDRDASSKIKLLADQLLNAGHSHDELVEIYLCDPAQKEKIGNNFQALLRDSSIHINSQRAAFVVLLHRVMLRVSDQANNPDRVWNSFIAEDWERWELLQEYKQDLLLDPFLYLAMIYNSEVHMLSPSHSDEEENEKLGSLQDSMRVAAKTWLASHSSFLKMI